MILALGLTSKSQICCLPGEEVQTTAKPPDARRRKGPGRPTNKELARLRATDTSRKIAQKGDAKAAQAAAPAKPKRLTAREKAEETKVGLGHR